MNIAVKHSTENSFWGWSQADLDSVNTEASTSKLNQAIKAEVQRLFPNASVAVDSGNYQDTVVEIDNPESELDSEYVRDAVGRVYGAMDWVVYK